MARLPRLPDLLTTANLACGTASIILASQGQLTAACWLVFAGALFDVLDGLAARALGGGTPLGAQLDSLADMVTFGVAPGIMVYITTLIAYPIMFDELYVLPNWNMAGLVMASEVAFSEGWFLLSIPLMITISSCWRLAKFNIDTRQTDGFLGLPTPFNALFWASMVLSATSGTKLIDIGSHEAIPLSLQFFSSSGVVALVALLLGVLMLSSLPLPSLKFKHFKWKGNEVIYLLLGIGAVLVIFLGFLAVPVILLLYLLSPIWGNLFPKDQPN